MCASDNGGADILVRPLVGCGVIMHHRAPAGTGRMGSVGPAEGGGPPSRPRSSYPWSHAVSVRPRTRPPSSSASCSLRLRTDAGPGWAQCGAPAEPLYTSEYGDAARHVLVHHLLPRVAEAGDATPDDVATALAPVQGHRMAKAALEMALLDAWGRLHHRSRVAAGLDLDCCAAGVAVGVTGSVDELLVSGRRYVEEGYRRVKLKVEPGWTSGRWPCPWALRAGPGPPGRCQRRLRALCRRRGRAGGPRPLRPAAHRAAAGRGRPRRPRCAGGIGGDADLPRRVRDLGGDGRPGPRPRRLLGHQREARPDGGYLEAGRLHDLALARGVPLGAAGRGDGPRPGGQRGARRPPGLHAAGRPVRVTSRPRV